MMRNLTPNILNIVPYCLSRPALTSLPTTKPSPPLRWAAASAFLLLQCRSHRGRAGQAWMSILG